MNHLETLSLEEARDGNEVPILGDENRHIVGILLGEPHHVGGKPGVEAFLFGSQHAGPADGADWDRLMAGRAFRRVPKSVCD